VVVLDGFIIAFKCDETVMGFLGFHYFSAFCVFYAPVFYEIQENSAAFRL
jgi:hypothetical protein